MYKGIGLTVAVAMSAVVGTGAANAVDKVKAGVTATLEGTYTVLGEDGMRGYELAVQAHGGKAGGKEIETIVGAYRCQPGFGCACRQKTGRTGQGRYSDLAAVGFGGHRDPRLLEDPAADHRYECGVRRTRDDLRRSIRRYHAVADFLPHQHGRRPMAGGPRRLCLQRERLQENRGSSGRITPSSIHR